MTASRSAGNDGSSATSPDDAVYCNKQLIAHLLKKVCSAQLCSANGGGGGGGGGHNNNYNSYNNNYRANASSKSSSSSRAQSSSDSSRSSWSPDESDQQQQQQQQHHHQQSQHQQQHGDTVDGAAPPPPPPTAPTSDYLTASSASGLSQSLSAQSASPAYVSPFALTPVSESSPWSHPAISLDVIKDERTAELERIVLELCREFEQRLHGRFQDFSAKLDTEPATIRESVTHELETLFYDDNVHWGRVIAVFVLAKEMCDKCLAENRPQLAAAVQQWVAEFIDQNLWDWVRKNQGWYGLVRFYRETGGDGGAAAASPLTLGSWSPMASLLAVSAVSIAVALVAAYFRR